MLTVPGYLLRNVSSDCFSESVEPAACRSLASSDAAVVASMAATEADRALHLDLLLQRVVVTEIGADRDSLARQRVESEVSTGLSKLMDVWAKLIASRFVQQTRFDPFHHGETEQDLYDRLPGWIEEIGRDGFALLTLEHRDKATCCRDLRW